MRELSRYAVGAVLVRTADEGARLALVLLGIGRLNSAAVGSVMVAVLLIPHVVAAPIVGLITDRVAAPSRVIGLAALGFAAALAGSAMMLANVSFALVVVVLLIGGCCGPALTGALSSQLPGLVRPLALPRTFGLDSLTYNVSGIAGPALVATVSVAGSPMLATAALSGCAAAGGLVLAGLPILRRRSVVDPATRAPRVTDGMNLLLRDRVLGLVTAATTVGQVGFGALPVVVAVRAARQHAPSASGWLLTAFAVGGLVGSLVWIGHPTTARRAPAVVMASLLVAGASLAIAAVSTTLPQTMILFMLSGSCTGPLTGALFTTREDRSPGAARAQLFTLGAGLKITAAAVGLVAAGAVAQLPGATLLVICAACPGLAGAVGCFLLLVGHTERVPRQNRRRPEESPATDAAALGRGSVRRESGSDGDWLVRPVTGAAATKTYRCPGCQQEIRPATAHVVAWPDHSGSDADGPGLSDRRHWHTACWNARTRRRPQY